MKKFSHLLFLLFVKREVPYLVIKQWVFWTPQHPVNTLDWFGGRFCSTNWWRRWFRSFWSKIIHIWPLSLISYHSTNTKHYYREYTDDDKVNKTRRVPLVEQELLIHPVHLNTPQVFSGVRVTQFLVLCVVFCRSLFVLLFIVLSVLRSDFDYPFIIFQLCFNLFEIASV